MSLRLSINCCLKSAGELNLFVTPCRFNDKKSFLFLGFITFTRYLYTVDVVLSAYGGGGGGGGGRGEGGLIRNSYSVTRTCTHTSRDDHATAI